MNLKSLYLPLGVFAAIVVALQLAIPGIALATAIAIAVACSMLVLQAQFMLSL